jgi:hypothetical protein
VAGDAGRSAVPVGELLRPSLQGGGAIPAGAARWVLLGQGQRGVCVEHMSCIQQVWLSLRVFIIGYEYYYYYIMIIYHNNILIYHNNILL